MIRKSVNVCLSNCVQITNSSEKISKIIRDLNKVKSGEEYNNLDKFIKKRIVRENYQCKHQAFINAPMKQELKYLEKVLTNPEVFKLETPISHLINREYDITSKGDACLEACGGYSDECEFWIHHEFSEEIKKLTLKRLKIRLKKENSSELICINVLEFVIDIILYAAVTVHVRENPHLFPHIYVNYLNFSDNTSTVSWNKKAALRSPKAKSLQLILCSIMINNTVGLKGEHISGINNDCADKISRVYSKSNSPPSFKSLFQEYPSLKEWKRFHPSPELLSDLYSALLEGRAPEPSPRKNLGHFTHVNNITKTS